MHTALVAVLELYIHACRPSRAEIVHTFLHHYCRWSPLCIFAMFIPPSAVAPAYPTVPPPWLQHSGIEKEFTTCPILKFQISWCPFARTVCEALSILSAHSRGNFQPGLNMLVHHASPGGYCHCARKKLPVAGFGLSIAVDYGTTGARLSCSEW